MQLDRSQEPSPQKHGEPRSLNEHRQPHRRRKKRKSFRRRQPTSRRPEQAPWLSHQATRNQSPLQGQAIFPLSHRRKKNHPRGAKDTRPHQLQQQPTGVGRKIRRRLHQAAANRSADGHLPTSKRTTSYLPTQGGIPHRMAAGARPTEDVNAGTRLEENYPPSILAGDDAVAATAAGEVKGNT